MPHLEIRPVDRRKKQSVWLSRHARNATSQHGQDGVIAKIFETIGTTTKACCEFGAWDGKRYSNTFSLIAEQGWAGYLIEGNPQRCAEIEKNHSHNPKAHAINAMVGFEGDALIDSILQRAGAPRDLDLMVIDIDGNDWHIWDSMERYRPRVVAIEYHPHIGNDVYFVQDRDWSLRQGNSLLALIELGKKKGYELVSTCGDAFFVREELFPHFKIDDNSLDAMHYVRTETKSFGGYDGKMWHVGHMSVGWQAKRKFAPDELQALEEFKYKT